MSDVARWGAGLALALVVASGARRAGALSAGGALAAAAMGTLAVGVGWSWGILLMGYFVASATLSHVGRAERDRRTGGRLAKGGARDALQVLANGSAFATAAAAFLATRNPAWQLVAAAALAASAADTWATEIGTLSRSAARSVVTGAVVPAGTSGGVTVLGLAAAFAGAAFIGGIASSVGWAPPVTAAALVGGVAGALIDSLLGATLQSRRWCAACRTDTEERVHRCGTATEHRAGIAWLDNDGVNATSTIAGAIAGTLLAGRV